MRRKDRTPTHALTPPINPKLYPVAKSSFLPAPPGLSGFVFCPPLPTVPLLREPPISTLFLALRAGLLGRLFCQSWRSSLVSSCPVAVQLFRMLSRSSATWRLISSSFFLSHETLSSCLEAPRLSCRVIYLS